jgi:hypothetical protein
VTPSQLTVLGTALLTSLLAACAHTNVVNDGVIEERADGDSAPCGYTRDHDIYSRLNCLRISLERVMPPNSRFVSDASASARRASYSAPQSGR